MERRLLAATHTVSAYTLLNSKLRMTRARYQHCECLVFANGGVSAVLICVSILMFIDDKFRFH